MAVAEHFGVEVADILGRSRLSQFVKPRHVAMWILRQRGLSFPEIARRTNRGDHTTCLSAFHRVEADAALKATAAEILAALKTAEGVDHGL